MRRRPGPGRPEKMKLTIAEHAGFCPGVRRATDALERALDARADGESIYTLGRLIHNDEYIRVW